MKHILRCKSCGKYTMNISCRCGGEAVTVIPAKYSPDDKYADYRRKVKRAELEKRGAL